MKIKTPQRWIAGLVLATVAVATLSPAAQADHSRWRRYKGAPGYCPTPVVRHVVYSPRPVYYYQRHSSAAPLVAGLIGGLVIGTAIAHAAQPVAVHASYGYYDPYCEESFATLDLYRSHLYRHHHPQVVRVIELDSGSCVDSYRWSDGGWRSWDGDDEGWDE